MRQHNRRGFTLVELLVVIAIIGILIAMSMPAVQASREAARRIACLHNLTRLGIALQDYQSAHESLPPGVTNPEGPVRNVAEGIHTGWIVSLLPYIDEQPTFESFDASVGVYDEKNAPTRGIPIGLLRCPSYNGPYRLEAAGAVNSNYAGCQHDVEKPIDEDNQGVLFLNSQIRSEDVTDGVTHTIFLGEKLGNEGELGWMSGTRATLRNTGTRLNRTPGDYGYIDRSVVVDANEDGDGEPVRNPTEDELFVGGFGSSHAAVTNLLFGDGAVRSVSNNIEPAILQQLGHRADGKLLADGPTREAL
ncbi:MAG: DUF1559 domain-containing protein [Thermoguttaceae bacterium]